MTKPLLFPLELYNHPCVSSLNLCQAGLFRLLIESYWKSGVPLPKIDNQLIRLSNADFVTYKKYSPKVKEALEIVMPFFIQAREKRSFQRCNFQKKAEQMRLKAKDKRKAKDVSFSDDQDTHVKITPISPDMEKRNYNQGYYDPVAVKSARKSNENKKGVLLTDK